MLWDRRPELIEGEAVEAAVDTAQEGGCLMNVGIQRHQFRVLHHSLILLITDHTMYWGWNLGLCM